MHVMQPETDTARKHSRNYKPLPTQTAC